MALLEEEERGPGAFILRDYLLREVEQEAQRSIENSSSLEQIKNLVMVGAGNKVVASWVGTAVAAGRVVGSGRKPRSAAG